MDSEQTLPIEHVVVLMMENNCFDRMLGSMATVHAGLDGVDVARPHSNPAAAPGAPDLVQRETISRNIDRDPKHYLANSLAQFADGTNGGFVADFVRTHPNSTPEERQEIMGYFPRGFLPGLHTLAENFVVCDRWFSSLPGPTWINRLFAHSGTSRGHVNEPGGLFSSKLHMYGQRTLYDELSDAGVPWRIYYGDVPQTLVLSHQWHHLGNYRHYAHWQDDVAKGDLAGYTFIEPSYFGPHQNDQHPPHDIMRGDALIAEVYNTLRANPGLFEKTLLVVLYDEHGGFYDHVVPPATVPPDEHTEHFAFDLLGFRVPAIFVSPMLDPGVISTEFDHTSLLKMASRIWPGVKPLGRRAEQANDPIASMTWRTTPRRDLPEAGVAPDIQEARPVAMLEGFKASLFGFSHHIESEIQHAGHKGGLMQRAHEALGDGLSQAKLATDRLAVFIDERQKTSGVLGTIERGFDAVAKTLGLGGKD
ncbi:MULTISPECIES: alkaline phosphatase family protein [Acidiphilium]|uniref:Phospholipase C n=1 Tax=Acidiphilium rubrum TaxID=526 RepID=A0A8G2CL94_ACIRU|nr:MULTISPECIES: alkaline phosphatase family protein [Acidiphilium]SIQ68754.1 phospholipase C [Acidiphilium rubrum]